MNARIKVANESRAAIYARMSTGEQGDSPAQQEAKCREKAEALGLQVAKEHVFVDAAISGSRLDRPRYRALLDAAKAREFGTLVIWKQNRLGRDQPEVERAIRQLEHAGVRVVACDGYDTNGQSEKNRKLLRGITGLVDQVYIDNLGEDVHRGQSSKVEKKVGLFMGGKPFGYRLIPVRSNTERDPYGEPKRIGTTLVVEPDEAAIIKEIFELYAVGMSPQAIAVELNRRNVPAPGAKWTKTQHNVAGKWLSSTISSDPQRGLGIINQRLYIGEYIWNRSRWKKDPGTNKPVRLDRPESEWKKDVRHEWRIVSDDLWQRVRMRQEQRRASRGPAIAAGIASAKRRGGRDSRYLLGGILKCGVCGANLIGYSRTEYVCPAHDSGACANNLRVPRDAIHEAVFNALKEHVLNREVIAQCRKMLEEELARRAKDERAALKAGAHTKELERLDQQVAELRALNLSPTALAAAVAAIESERKDIMSAATAKVGDRQIRAERLIARVPAIVDESRRQIENGLKVLADARAVTGGREAIRKLLEDGTITLTPDAEQSALTGVIRFVDLGEHMLEQAGIRRSVGLRGAEETSARNSGRGDRI